MSSKNTGLLMNEMSSVLFKLTIALCMCNIRCVYQTVNVKFKRLFPMIFFCLFSFSGTFFQCPIIIHFTLTRRGLK